MRWLFIPLLAPALAGMASYIDLRGGRQIYNIKYAIPGFAAGLFICCLFCHGELARRRPAPRHLTLFYLMVSIGGALGGIFVALIAPRVFRIYWELPLGLIACGILAMIAVWGLRLPKLGAWPIRAFIFVAVAVLAGYFIRQESKLSKNLVLQARNFYGPLEVRDDLPTEDYAQRTLLHGTIDHGSQLQGSGAALWSPPRITPKRFRASGPRDGRFTSEGSDSRRCGSDWGRACSPTMDARAITSASTKLILWSNGSRKRYSLSIRIQQRTRRF